MLIDLHTHSTASDGTDSPADLVRAAGAAGLDIVAITDHDTTAGWAEAVAALPAGLALVRGIEMSCEGRGEDGRPVAVHLLAYLFDPAHAAFARERERLRNERIVRIRAMAELMMEDGLPIDADEVLAEAGPAAGRPHLARALMRAGVVGSVGEAFVDLLAPRGRYFVDKSDTPLDEAVQLVAEAGGVSVLAHGRARTRGRLLSLDHVRDLAGAGLHGLEVHHPDHSPEDARVLHALADERGLVVTGSSDYHGTNKAIRLGEFTTTADEFDTLVSKASGVQVVSA
ncbi:PHP domain-containing protein [Rhodococcus sp. NCIMB 12038]|uniref:PHP domain-containing protein n=1 Tax=Rhodococcus sp. NCIMB 12038 TaxID=933800 RepID=UPI000B3BE4D4|nr:PHP domain-containing protein [Rhodococcus sp. NCIMB 12038]OUS93770.1 phosphatase [Rhodococcus sp. NCIMB 12038]